MLYEREKSVVTKNREIAKKYTEWAVLLKKSGLATPKFEICTITNEIGMKLYSISNILPIEIHAALIDNGIYTVLDYDKSYNFIESIIREILHHKDIITNDPKNNTEDSNIWIEEYNKTMNQPWAQYLVNN